MREAKEEKIKEESKSMVPANSSVKLERPFAVSEELRVITIKIQADIGELKEIVNSVREKRQRAIDLRSGITGQLIYVRKNKKALLGERNFTDYLEKDIGITRGHLSEQIKAYELCEENNKPEYFNSIDTKVLVGIARIKNKEVQKKLFERAPELTREDIKNVRRSNILGKSSSSQESAHEVADFLEDLKIDLSQQIGSDMYQKIYNFGEQIENLFNIADSIDQCETLKETFQRMIDIKHSGTLKKWNPGLEESNGSENNNGNEQNEQ